MDRLPFQTSDWILFSIDDKHGFRSHGTQFVLSRHQIIQCDCRTVGR